jgi:hypothetical protein
MTISDLALMTNRAMTITISLIQIGIVGDLRLEGLAAGIVDPTNLLLCGGRVS